MSIRFKFSSLGNESQAAELWSANRSRKLLSKMLSKAIVYDIFFFFKIGFSSFRWFSIEKRINSVPKVNVNRDQTKYFSCFRFESTIYDYELRFTEFEELKRLFLTLSNFFLNIERFDGEWIFGNGGSIINLKESSKSLWNEEMRWKLFV